MVECKMHKAMHALAKRKFGCILQPAACKEGVARRKAV